MSPSDPPPSRILSTFDRCHRPKYHPRPHADEFTRCDILPDSEPPLCQHCKQYGFECTFFLPIAETRFKKKKLEEEAAEKARSENTDGRNSSTPLGESSRSADARVYGAASSVHHPFASLDPPLSQDQLPKLIFFIPVPQFLHDYMKITTLDITIHGRYLRVVMGSSR